MFSCQPFLTGTNEKQTSSKSKVRKRSCRGFSPHQGRGGFISKFHTHAISSQESVHWRVGLLLNLTIDQRVLGVQQQHTQRVWSWDVCWSPRNLITARLSCPTGIASINKIPAQLLKGVFKILFSIMCCRTVHRTTGPKLQF